MDVKERFHGSVSLGMWGTGVNTIYSKGIVLSVPRAGDAWLATIPIPGDLQKLRNVPPCKYVFVRVNSRQSVVALGIRNNQNQFSW